MRIKWFSYIRVIGLVFVLLYHFFLKYFPGGFVGVDIFFTLSGYFITALFIDEYVRTKAIDVVGFAKRRLYRILPSLVFMILVTLPLTLLVRNDFRAGISSQILASLGFVTNLFEIISGGGYENQFTPHLFVHTWTLALEIQFYLVWVLAIWGLTKLVKSQGQLRGMIFLGSSFLFISSFLTMFVSSFFTKNVSAIYFSSWSHLFPFFLGAVLATLTGVSYTNAVFKKTVENWTIRRCLFVSAGALAVLILLLFFLKFETIWTYLFGLLLSTLASGVLIYTARILHEKTPGVTEPVFVSGLADISYGIYLFHWPLYTIFSQIFSSLVAVLLTVFFSSVFAVVSFYLLEPYLAGKPVRFLRLDLDLSAYHKWIVSAIGVFTLLGFLIVLTAPRLGDFETDYLVNSLKQADTRMEQTKVFAEQGKATSYDVAEGTTIIGDSVTLRSMTQLNQLSPDAIIDAQGSRNTTQAYAILQNNIENGTLLQNVVIATGVNVINNYEEELNNIVAALPKGHHLIFLTPYDGNYKEYADPIAEKHSTYLHELVTKYDFIVLADWNKVAKANPQIWAGTDNIHFGATAESTAEGAKLYAETIQKALEEAAKKPVKS